MMKIDDTIVFKDYVSPNICRDIMIAGFKPEVNFFWRGYTEGDLELISAIFDIDDYYKDGFIAADSISMPRFTLAAFTIKDIEQHFPPYCVCKDALGFYVIMLDDKYQVPSCQSKRLPDAYGLMMLSCLRNRIIDITKIKTTHQ